MGRLGEALPDGKEYMESEVQEMARRLWAKFLLE